VLLVNQPDGRIVIMKERLLDAAEELVQRKGLNGVTFQDLADAVGLRKPSVFHHIRNREELAIALIARCGTKHGPQYAAVIGQDLNASQKLLQLTEIFEQGLTSGRPCLLASIASGIESLTEPATEQLKIAADASISRFSEVFVQGREEGSLDYEGSPVDAATAFFAMMQGLQALCKAKGDAVGFKGAARSYVKSLTADSS